MSQAEINKINQPVIFRQQNAFIDWQQHHPEVVFNDVYPRQLKELFFLDHQAYIGQNKEQVYASEDFKKYSADKREDCNFIFYPWLNTVISCVREADYWRLKTNRNQDLITDSEQEILRTFRVGVLGMSVGSNIAFVLTQAGISNQIVLADFDELDTTNLNRILAGVHQVGLNKTVVAARRIYEDNPYAEITLLTEGVNQKNLEELLSAGRLDCLVEEIDEIGMKIETRRLAIKYRVPVVMITDNGDGVVLHVERYDLAYNKIFGREIAYWQEKMSGPMDKEKAGGIIINDIVGGIEHVDPKMIASVARVLKRELVSWSQLGSSAILGGVVANWAIKQIALKQSQTELVREYIKLEKI